MRRLRGVAAYFLFLLIGLALFPSSGRDDKYISFWPAMTLAEHGEILNYLHQRVEQSSTLLFVVLIAAARRLTGANVVLIGWAWSVAGGLVAIFLSGRLAARLTEARWAPIAAMFLTAQIPCLVYWSFSGMEMTVAAACVLAATITTADLAENGITLKNIVADVGATVAVSMVRPEAPLLLLAARLAVVGWVLFERHVRRTTSLDAARSSVLGALSALVTSTIVLSGVVLFRYVYFGALFPQPVTAKNTALGLRSLRDCYHYIGANPEILLVGAVAAVAVVLFVSDAWRGRRSPRARGMAVAMASAYAAFLLGTGGDWMEGGRFFVPFAPLLAVLSIDVVDRMVPHSRRSLVVAGLVIAQTAGCFVLAATRSIALPLWVAVDVQPVGDRPYHWLETIHREQRRDMYAVTAIEDVVQKVRATGADPVVFFAHNVGMAVFHTMLRHRRDVQIIDMRGLADRYFTDSTVGRSFPATVMGVDMGIEAYVERYAEIHAETGVPKAHLFLVHIAVNIDGYDLKTAYELVGEIPHLSIFSGRSVGSSQQIVVDGPTFRAMNPSPDWPVSVDVSNTFAVD